MNNIGQKIKELRKKNDLTQEKLADCLGVTHKAVSKWECGVTAPDLSLIVPLARVLHVTTDELLGMSAVEQDNLREKYDKGMEKYRDCEVAQVNYAWARAALMDYPHDYRYMEWLAFAEYQLAFEENQKGGGSADYIEEMTENALRRYETVMEQSNDSELKRRAALGKTTVLRFLERCDEADWSAEFEYPDPEIKTSGQLLLLSKTGRELLQLLEKEEKSNQ